MAKESTVIVLNKTSKVSGESSQIVFRIPLTIMQIELLILHSKHASSGIVGIALPLLCPGGILAGCEHSSIGKFRIVLPLLLNVES